jgi:hypothetical protein
MLKRRGGWMMTDVRYLIAVKYPGRSILYVQDATGVFLGRKETAYMFLYEHAVAIQNSTEYRGERTQLVRRVVQQNCVDICFAVSFVDAVIGDERFYVSSEAEATGYFYTDDRLRAEKFSHKHAEKHIRAFYPEAKAEIEYIPEWDWRQAVALEVAL